MERIPTKLIVEKGQVFTTDKPMPGQICKICSHADILAICDCEKAKESWKKEAYEVENPELLTRWPFGDNVDKSFHAALYKPKDGIYDCPDGLVFEVKEYCGCHLLTGPSDECIAAGGTNPYKCVKERNKVAILSFKRTQ